MLCRGQTIGAIVARSQTEALEAASAVDIEYEPLPVVISIQVCTDGIMILHLIAQSCISGCVILFVPIFRIILY